jgi:RNA polymerase sigma-70 factor (ECF subfamily)
MTGLATASSMTAILDQAVEGDEAAFARIVAAFHADMARVAYGICGDRAAAEDAVQSAWVIAWRKLRTVREPEHLRSWLIAVAANEARHALRRKRVATVTEIPVEIPAGDDVDPQGEIDNIDLGNALRHLSADERSLIALRYGAGLDSTEIAPILHVSPSGVRQRLMRTLEHLRKELRDD